MGIHHNQKKTIQTTHSGKLLKEEFKYINLTINKLAANTRIDRKIIDSIINESVNITPDIAFKLEKALNINADYWIRLQKKYDSSKQI